MRDALVNLVAKKLGILYRLVLNACRVMNTQDEEVAKNFLYLTIVKINARLEPNKQCQLN